MYSVKSMDYLCRKEKNINNLDNIIREEKYMITAMILAYNEAENIKKTIQSFRLFADIQISLVVVDNGSTDGLREWIKDQTDLTYVYMDEVSMGWAKAINSVKKELQIDTDLLIVEGHYALTPGYLQRLAKVLYEDNDIGAVGGIFNEAHYRQGIPGIVCSYGEAIELAGRESTGTSKQTVILDPGAILWKKGISDNIGDFSEELKSIYAVMADYCMRVIMGNRKLMVCPNALLWKLPTENQSALYPWEWELIKERWGICYLGSYSENLVHAIEKPENNEISVLEIGCANGGTLTEIRNRYPNAKVYGTEINAHAAALAVHFAEVVVNDMEEQNLPFHKNMFDYIIFGDVLEHLHEPLEILKYCREFLREGGYIIASIPNVMHISVMEQLLHGNFSYSEWGLLDKTHIHMFTYNEIIRTFHEAGYEIEMMETTKQLISEKQEKLIDDILSLGFEAERFMYEAFQYIVKARKKNV